MDLLNQSAKEPFGHINLPPFYLLPWTPSSTTIRPGAILVRHHSKVHLIWDKKMQKGWICKMKYPIYLEHFFLKNVMPFFLCFFVVFFPSTWLTLFIYLAKQSTCVLQPSSLPAVGCVFVSSGPVTPFTVKWWEWSQNSAQLSSSTPQPWPAHGRLGGQNCCVFWNRNLGGRGFNWKGYHSMFILFVRAYTCWYLYGLAI